MLAMNGWVNPKSHAQFVNRQTIKLDTKIQTDKVVNRHKHTNRYKHTHIDMFQNTT